MKTIFIIKKSFIISARRSFVLAGEIQQGTIVDGMIATSESKNLKHAIKSVEAVDFPGGTTLIGLVLEFGSDVELTILNSLTSGDQLIIS